MLFETVGQMYRMHNQTLSKVFREMVAAGANREDIVLEPCRTGQLELKTHLLLLNERMATVVTRAAGDNIESQVARVVNANEQGQSSPQHGVN